MKRIKEIEMQRTFAIILGAMLLIMSIYARAEDKFYVSSKQVSKLQAVLTLAKDPNAEVIKCQSVQLSDKATLTVRRK